MVPVYNGIKENQQEINVIHLNIRVGVVVESGDSDHFISNPLTLTELRLQISFEATVQTLTDNRVVLLITLKVTYNKIRHCIFFEYPRCRGCEFRRKCPLVFYLLWVLVKCA
jgi:hypothetical protein